MGLSRWSCSLICGDGYKRVRRGGLQGGGGGSFFLSYYHSGAGAKGQVIVLAGGAPQGHFRCPSGFRMRHREFDPWHSCPLERDAQQGSESDDHLGSGDEKSDSSTVAVESNLACTMESAKPETLTLADGNFFWAFCIHRHGAAMGRFGDGEERNVQIVSKSLSIPPK